MMTLRGMEITEAHPGHWLTALTSLKSMQVQAESLRPLLLWEFLWVHLWTFLYPRSTISLVFMFCPESTFFWSQDDCWLWWWNLHVPVLASCGVLPCEFAFPTGPADHEEGFTSRSSWTFGKAFHSFEQVFAFLSGCAFLGWSMRGEI